MHGTRSDPKRHHPVVDMDYWRGELSPEKGDRLHDMWIDSPKRLMHMEARRAKAFAKLKAAPVGAPVDLFLWGYGFGRPKEPSLTRVGGMPWRDSRKAWPKGKDGAPLTFLAQLCFVDSMDVIPGVDLPGEVLLIFGEFCRDYLVLNDGGGVVLEWSSMHLDNPTSFEHIPKNGLLSFELHGAIHRTMQYPDQDAIFDENSIRDSVWQGTIIGTQAFLPQSSSINGLIATLSSILPSTPWPLLNVPALPVCVFPKGHSHPIDLWQLGIGEAGVIFVTREENGRFSAEVEF